MHVHVSALRMYQHIDILSQWTFWHGVILAQGIFGTMDVSAWDILAPEHFGTCMDILVPCKAIWTFWHRHFGTCATMPECSCVEMSPCRNVHGAKKSLCQNVPVPKSPRTKTSICPNTYKAEMCMRRNVPVMKCLWPKC